MSRPRSARGANAPAATARTPGGRPGVFVQKPQSDVYVALLGVSFVAMVIGCVLLVLILKRYEFKSTVSALTPPAASVSLAARSERFDLTVA